MNKIYPFDRQKEEEKLEQLRRAETGAIVVPSTAERPQGGSVLGPLLRTEHTLGEIFTPSVGRYTRRPNAPDADFNPIEHIPPDLKNYAPAFAQASNREEFDDILFRVRDQLRDKEVIAGAPGRAFIGGLFLGLTDPTMALPGGVIYKAAKANWNVAKSAASLAAGGAFQSAAQESILLRTQETRTAEEAAWNTAATAMLSGVIGAAGGWFLNTPIGRKAKQDTVRELALGPPGPQPYPAGMGPKGPQPGGGAPGGSTVGAQFADVPGYVQQSESLYGVHKFVEPFFSKSPLAPTMIRMMFSEFQGAKRAAFDIFENNLLQNKNVFSYEATPHALETYISDARKRFLTPQLEFFNIFLDSIGATPGLKGDVIASLNWKNFEQFSQAAGFAARRGDKSDNPHVQSAVNVYRNKVYEPVKNWMKALGVMPEEHENVPTADSYLPKIINSAKVIANPEKFKQIIANGYRKIDLYLKENRGQITELETGIKKGETEIEKQVDLAIREKRIKESPVYPKYEAKVAEAKKEIKAKADVEIEKSRAKAEKEHQKADAKLAKYNEKIQKLKKKIESGGKKKEIAPLIKLVEKDIKALIKEKAQINKNLAQRSKLIKDKYKRIEQDNLAKLKAGLDEAIKEFDLEVGEKVWELEDLMAALKREEDITIRANDNKIEAIKEKINKVKSLLEEIPPEQRGFISNMIAELQAKKKELETLVPRFYRNSEGEIPKAERDINEIGEIANNIYNSYLGRQEERVLNPFLDQMINPKGKPFHERVVMVMDTEMEEFLINDIMDLTNRFVRGTVPYLQLLERARKAGFETIDEMRQSYIKDIEFEYDEIVASGKDYNGKELTEKKRQKLNNDRKKQLNNVNNSFDMLLGIYGQGMNIENGGYARFANMIRDWTTSRFMGHMGIASLTELTAAVLKIGPGKLVNDGIRPYIKSMIEGFQAGKYTQDELKSMGYGIQSQMGIQLKSYLDQEGLSTQPGYLRKFIDVSVGILGKVTGSDYIQVASENIAGAAMVNVTLRRIKALVDGTISHRDRIELANAGIDETNVKALYDRIEKYGSFKDDDMYAAHDDWPSASNEDIEAIRLYRNTIIKQINSSVITKPGLGDKSDFQYTPTGTLILQFKSWMIAANNKLLLAGIQRSDREFFLGIMVQIGMGAVINAINSLIKEGEVNQDTSLFIRNAIDYSGITGITGEIFNIAQKAGVLPGNGVARYKSRGILGALLGPTAGTVEDAARVMSLITNPQDVTFSDSELRLIKRMFPHQNNAVIGTISRAVQAVSENE